MPTSDHMIGGINNKNGMCGFAASVYMACKIDPTRIPTITQSNLARRTLVEIAHFLQTIKSSNQQLFQEIGKYTQSFGDKYKNFDMDQFIGLCNFAVNVTEKHILDEGGYDIAMTPNAVAAYLKLAWDIDAKAQQVNGGQGNGNCIIGLCGNGKGLYNDLKHWVYRHNGVYYSWGNTYPDVKSMTPGLKVGWIVS